MSTFYWFILVLGILNFIYLTATFGMRNTQHENTMFGGFLATLGMIGLSFFVKWIV